MNGEGGTFLSVSVPVLLIDTILPTLRDTELRLLLVVLRQLQVEGHEREAAWLTHRELCRRTGRAGEAVSAAIAGLCERGLLEVRGEGGQILSSARTRQLASGRRFFCLSGPLVAGSPFRFPKSKAEKPKTIDTKEIDIYSLRLSETLTTEQAERIEREKQRIRERLYRRPRTGGLADSNKKSLLSPNASIGPGSAGELRIKESEPIRNVP